MDGVSEHLLCHDEVSKWRSLGGHHGRSIEAAMYIVVRLCAYWCTRTHQSAAAPMLSRARASRVTPHDATQCAILSLIHI